ncbi:hypothetical protein IEQ34_020548 [Dendrobium chrysotoxum]|uniref:Protein kinase domain-containing protein n=1 Tax=Dendrobium chrysotoxum TaxID=161865 RepID=A0AAV7G174_DENCH|nr:hypothetical protein IEQ34_020548 [Dendrobium chrysotoxum]
MAAADWLRGPAIGRGATATVSLAADASSGDLFAVKSAELSRSVLLQREESILSSLNSPSVVSCLGFDIAPGPGGILFYNLFLEYAGGGSLADEIKRCGGSLDEKSARSLSLEILNGLAYLHASGIVHCDVKPENVLIGSNSRAIIGDLGCARRISDGEREIRGSPMYMAPEAARGQEQGTPADVWAFGCTVIEMVTGRPPWPDVADPAGAIRRIGFSSDAPAIPAWFSDEAKDFVANCLRIDPEERWTAEQLLRHPFVDTSSSVSNCTNFRVSPKSTLDLGLWESMEKEEEREEEEEEEFLQESAVWRIHELASASSCPNWTWDEDWKDARSFTGECTAEEDTVPAGVALVEEFLIAADGESTNGCDQCVFAIDDLGNKACKYSHWQKGDYIKLGMIVLDRPVRYTYRPGRSDQIQKPMTGRLTALKSRKDSAKSITAYQLPNQNKVKTPSQKFRSPEVVSGDQILKSINQQRTFELLSLPPEAGREPTNFFRFHLKRAENPGSSCERSSHDEH